MIFFIYSLRLVFSNNYSYKTHQLLPFKYRLINHKNRIKKKERKEKGKGWKKAKSEIAIKAYVPIQDENRPKQFSRLWINGLSLIPLASNFRDRFINDGRTAQSSSFISASSSSSWTVPTIKPIEAWTNSFLSSEGEFASRTIFG